MYLYRVKHMNLSMLLTGLMTKQSTDGDNLSLSGHRPHHSKLRGGLLRRHREACQFLGSLCDNRDSTSWHAFFSRFEGRGLDVASSRVNFKNASSCNSLYTSVACCWAPPQAINSLVQSPFDILLGDSARRITTRRYNNLGL